ncbi:non-specific lipid-transfer protein 1-like [Herrania umbratica]|uniref:Non-specific lipid-transfer protein n=1 Tax=Herrania umbratica TaxID=108875 RepID=A0A6J1B6L9_9ROSI|nr:non-specific lipid-transfer protein 1-like [Herrania umbratica]
MGLSWYLGVVGLVVLVSTASSVHGMTCQQALTELSPCGPFLRDMAPSPAAPCCTAVSDVNAAASTTQARRDLCECFEKNASAYGVKPEKAKLLPGLCGVTVPVPIDPTVNCKTIK